MTAPRLRAVRELRCYSQRELAQITGLNRMTIRHVEAGGDARPQTIRRLAQALSVEPQSLLEEADVEVTIPLTEHPFTPEHTLFQGEHPTWQS